MRLSRRLVDDNHPVFSTFVFYCIHPRPPPLRSHFTGGWMRCSVDSEMREEERNDMEMAMAM